MAVIWHDINRMTSNTSLSPILAIYGGGVNRTTAAFRIFDGDNVTSAMHYQHTESSDGYFGIDFGQVVPLSNLKFYKYKTTQLNYEHLTEFDVETSTNGTNWILNKHISINRSVGVSTDNLYEVSFNYVEARYIRIKNMKDTRITDGIVFEYHASNGILELYFGYEPPTYKATIELYDANTLAKITSSISATLLKNGVSNRTLTITDGSILIDDLDDTSKWAIRTTQNTSYNAISATSFVPTYGNPTVKLYLKPTVKKKFNFKDENGIALSGKSIILKIYKDGSTTELIDTTVTTSTYTTTTLYDGSYTFEITCEGYNKIRGILAYDNSELNINFTLFTPTNKTLILHDGEYIAFKYQNKTILEWYETKMTSNTTPAPFVASASSSMTAYPAWQAFDGLIGEGSAWASNGFTSPQWIQIDYGSVKKTNLLSLTFRDSTDVGGMVKKFQILASNNGVDYTQVLEVNNETNWNPTETRIFKFNETVNYRYYKLNVLENNGITTYTIIGEVKYGFEGDSVDFSKPPVLEMISPTLPTQEQFLTEGMDSLTPLLDRRIETLDPLKMDSKSEILQDDEVGKVFSKTINLKKYLDIRNMKVEVR